MRRLFALLLPLLALAAHPARADVVTETVNHADGVTVIETVEYIDEDDAALAPGSERFVSIDAVPVPTGIAQYGPFRVLDPTRAALVDVTDERSPAQFAALLRAYPGIVMLEMVECPGTEDDRANLALGRLIRARGIATHVPDGGSVRSGAVELFLAGAKRIADPRSEFAVHSWADDRGREAADYPADAPENHAYLDYYREMGLAADEASAFYAMTNSVPNADAKWLTAQEMARWVRLD